MTLPELDNEVTARQKAAILLIALGQQTTAEVMKYLSDFEIEEIAQAIAEVEVRKVGFERFVKVFAERQSLLYGLLAVLMSVGTGWIAGRLFAMI